MVKNAEIKISNKMLQILFVYSKQTIRDEMDNIEKYERLTFVEFLEYIGRVAYQSQKDIQGKEFIHMLESTLEAILRVFNMKRKIPNFEVDMESESDYGEDD